MERVKKILPITTLALLTIFLRFHNLGYSEYMSDEPGTFFYRGYGVDKELSHWEFLLKQRKGPMQILVGYIPYILVGDYSNEFAQRFPFALFSALTVLLFYKLISDLTRDKLIGFVSAFLLSTNGLIVGYGRIAQYQNLNLFFSFASLWFFSRIRFTSDKPTVVKNTLLGSLMFCISLLSHWDAVYILIPIIYFLVIFFADRKVEYKFKLKVALLNLLAIIFVLAPFMLPYIKYQIQLQASMDYLDSIVGLGRSFLDRQDIKQFNLYNPFYTLYFYLIMGTIGSLRKDARLFLIWFLTVFAVFRFGISYSGLHFFNIFIPLVVLAGFGARTIINLNKVSKYIFLPILIAFLAFFYYQSYILFVDHTREYPTESEKILWLIVERKEAGDDYRHKTGFPHKRYWKEINAFINEQNSLLNENCGYITNESRIQEFYMDTQKENDKACYVIGIKRPLSLQYDYKFSRIKNKHTIKKINNEKGNTVAQIWRVEQ